MNKNNNANNEQVKGRLCAENILEVIFFLCILTRCVSRFIPASFGGILLPTVLVTGGVTMLMLGVLHLCSAMKKKG